MSNEIPEFVFHIISKYKLKIIPINSVSNENICTCKDVNCSSVGKHPLLKWNWKLCATNDLNKIKNWIEKYKNINFAVATGLNNEINNKFLTIIDVDIPNHELIEKLPKTLSYKTSKGGYHFWYWTNEQLPNSASKYYKHVDIRGKNGYAIIPPSKNNIGSYSFVSSHIDEIFHLTNDIIENLFPIKQVDEKENNCTTVKNKRKNNKQIKHFIGSFDNFFWSEAPVSSLREKIEKGYKIPMGLRNNTIHRLLSSDRARGANLEHLQSMASYYHSCLEKPETFQQAELQKIVFSVFKYPSYNNDFENVNLIYCKWLNKNNKDNVASLDKLIELDNEFFNNLKKGDFNTSLDEIRKFRNDFYRSKNIKHFSYYKPQALAKKLVSLGFEKKKTNKNNLWNVELF